MDDQKTLQLNLNIVYRGYQKENERESKRHCLNNGVNKHCTFFQKIVDVGNNFCQLFDFLIRAGIAVQEPLVFI